MQGGKFVGVIMLFSGVADNLPSTFHRFMTRKEWRVLWCGTAIALDHII
jgi:hypothetical protein